jgi:multidrug efflux pump subunit AcrB
MLKNLIRFFVHNPIIVNVVLVVITILGIYVGYSLKKEDYPDIEMNIIRINTNYVGGSLRDTELLITKPIEEELKGINGIEKFRSSTSAGRSNIMVWLNVWGVEKYNTLQNIREAVSIAQRLFPDNVDPPQVIEMKMASKPIIQYQIHAKNLDDITINTLAKNFKDTLQAVAGVSQVDISGYRERQIKIQFNNSKLLKDNISILDINTALKNYVVRQSAGALTSPGLNHNINILTEFEKIDQIKNINIRRSFSISGINIRDIADVENTLEDKALFVRGNLESAITLTVYKEDNADAFRVVERLYKVKDEFEKTLQYRYSAFPLKIQENLKLLQNNPLFLGNVERLEQQAKLYYKSNVAISAFNDTTVETKKLLAITVNNAISGMILVLVVLWIFLDFSIAFWIATSIPFIIMVLFIVMFFSGQSINNVMLFGLIVALAISVDDGIVVSENIYKLKGRGLSGKEAAIEGSHSLLLPLFSTLMTTIFSFLPFFVIKDLNFLFFKQVPLVIIICFLASTLEVICIFPSHLSHTNHKKLLAFKEGKKTSSWGDRFFEKLKDKYEKLLHIILKRRYFFLVGALAVLFLGVILAKQLKFTMFKDDENQKIEIRLRAEDGISLEQMDKRVARLEQKILKEFGDIGKENIETMVTTVGSRNINPTDMNNTNPNTANIVIFLKSLADGDRQTSETLIQKLEKSLQEYSSFYQWLHFEPIRNLSLTSEFLKDPTYDKYHELLKHFQNYMNPLSQEELGYKNWLSSYLKRQLKVGNISSYQVFREEMRDYIRTKYGFTELQISQPAFGPRQSNPVEVVVSGNDDELRENALQNVYQFMQNIPGVFSLQIAKSDQEKELSIKFDIPKMDKLGVKASSVAESIRTAFLGTQVGSITRADESIAIIVMLSKKDRNKLSSIENLVIPTTYNKVVPLKTIASLELKDDLSRISRDEAQRASIITADVNKKEIDVLQVGKIIQNNIPKLLVKYPGVGIKLRGEISDAKDTKREMTTVFLIGFTGIFFTLLFMFRSVSQPLIIVSVIPFGFVGVVFAFFIHGELFSFFAIIGIIGLCGVLINDAIVMIDFLNSMFNYKAHKVPSQERVLGVAKGAKERLRPIVLTALTAVAGDLPTVYGWGGSVSILRPLAMALGYGCLFGMFMTLILVPILYFMDSDIKSFFLFLKNLITNKNSK